jgi:hypothetical protein
LSSGPPPADPPCARPGRPVVERGEGSPPRRPDGPRWLARGPRRKECFKHLGVRGEIVEGGEGAGTAPRSGRDRRCDVPAVNEGFRPPARRPAPCSRPFPGNERTKGNGTCSRGRGESLKHLFFLCRDLCSSGEVRWCAGRLFGGQVFRVVPSCTRSEEPSRARNAPACRAILRDLNDADGPPSSESEDGSRRPNLRRRSFRRPSPRRP